MSGTPEQYNPVSWVEGYKLEALPEAARYRFSRLLRVAAINGEGFRAMSDAQLEQPLFPGSDTLLKQLRHIVKHTFANVEVIGQATDTQPGVLKSYNYVEQFPELASVETLGKDQLIGMFEQSISRLFQLFQQPGILERKITKPYKPPVSVLDGLNDLSEHLYLHAQNMIDYYEKFNLPRSASMKAALG